MDGTPFNASGPSSSFVFDIYTDGQIRNAPPALPGGPCNYTDQTLPRCGCRRFWSRPSAVGGLQDPYTSGLAEICMCSHHACFHEDAQLPSMLPAATPGLVAGQENQRPKTNREPLSPVQDLSSFHIPGGVITSLDLEMLNYQGSVSEYSFQGANPLHIEEANPKHDSPLPDTLNGWANMIQTQSTRSISHSSYPPQGPGPSQPPSTAPSSQARYLRPFAGKGLQTLSGGSALRKETLQDQPQAAYESDRLALQPVSEDPGPNDNPPDRSREATPRASQSQECAFDRKKREEMKVLSDTVKGHEQRIDRLENISFSVAGHEECHDKHENIDVRVTELESRVEEVERILNDTNSIASSRRTVRADTTADDATASVVSVSTSASDMALSRAELYSQMQELRAQISQLQSVSLPSYTKPWEVEVVFLPFPLKGIWMEAHKFPPHRQSTGSNADEWTQMPNTISRSTPDPHSQKFGEWAGQSDDSNWLLPRAFAAGRIIEQRLKSRGLIKTVLVRGPDARSIQLAIHKAFEDIFRISSSRSGHHLSSPLSEFLGLRQSWVPLRKIHKDSRLRFLTPAEMATPALWDFTFLESSVVMKASGLHRLYVTQPEAYLQDQPMAYDESGWSWQKLRELSRVYPDSQSSSGDIPEADALEECWAWNERFDEPPTANTSAISLRQSHQRISRRSSSISQQYFTAESPILSSSPGFVRAQSPMIQRDRRGSRPPNIRTGSVPPVVPLASSSSQARRRVSTHSIMPTPYERRSSPFVPKPSPRLPRQTTPLAPISTTYAAATKRRLGTRSPSVIPRNTPLWSRSSMSRSPSLAPFPHQGYHEERPNERRPTPAYYATPHSEAIPDFNAYQRGGSRGPMIVSNGYEPDDEEMGDSFEDPGSSTDPYDSQMTDDADDVAAHPSMGPRKSVVNEDSEIDVYEDDDEDELDGIETDGGNDPSGWQGFGQGALVKSEHPRPEDIPWAGIEDLMSDGENVDPDSQEIEIHEDEDMEIQDNGDGDDTDAGSATSSQAPSEYSSKPHAHQGLWPVPLAGQNNVTVGHDKAYRRHSAGATFNRDSSMGFEIHEDEGHDN
ncbi:midasin [Naviculisporaceae sp. PSN 640]